MMREAARNGSPAAAAVVAGHTTTMRMWVTETDDDGAAAMAATASAASGLEGMSAKVALAVAMCARSLRTGRGIAADSPAWSQARACTPLTPLSRLARLPPREVRRPHQP
jgi:hypothetical protein